MKFSVAALVAFATAGLAQPVLTNSDYTIEEGKPFTITWSNSEGPVTITLKNGDSEDLQDVDVIASGLTGDSFTWTPENLPSDTYAIEINDASGVPNYSPQFVYEGSGPAPSASSSAKSTASPSVTSSASESSASSSASETSSAPESSGTAESSSITTTTKPTTTRAIPTATPTNQNSEGQRFSSPLALLLVTVAAVFFFN